MLKDAAYATPDPERALNNLLSFTSENPSKTDYLQAHIRSVSMLFSFSQFLANYCVANPDALFDALKDLDSPQNREGLSRAFYTGLHEKTETLPRSRALDPYMAVVRELKMRETLRITLRDIMKKIDLVEVMCELSTLADVVLENSLSHVIKVGFPFS